MGELRRRKLPGGRDGAQKAVTLAMEGRASYFCDDTCVTRRRWWRALRRGEEEASLALRRSCGGPRRRTWARTWDCAGGSLGRLAGTSSMTLAIEVSNARGHRVGRRREVSWGEREGRVRLPWPMCKVSLPIHAAHRTQNEPMRCKFTDQNLFIPMGLAHLVWAWLIGQAK